MLRNAVTAGELIRRELADGVSQFAIAKKLAASNDENDANVKRWRFVVMRAARGAEPAPENRPRIAEVYGVPLTKLERPKKPGLGSPSDLADRLEEHEAKIAGVLETQRNGLRTQNEILDELKALDDALKQLRKDVGSLQQAVRSAPTQSQESSR